MFVYANLTMGLVCNNSNISIPIVYLIPNATGGKEIFFKTLEITVAHLHTHISQTDIWALLVC